MTLSQFRQSLQQPDLAKLLLRLCAGFLMLFHGVGKIAGGLGYIQSTLAEVGLPSFIAYGVYIGEILVPICLILGIASRLGALVLVVNMVFALFLAHRHTLFAVSPTGGLSIELDIFYIVIAVAIALLGGGKHSMKFLSEWN